MTYLPVLAGEVSIVNTNSALATTAFNTRSNTAQGGTLTSITLDASASGSDDTYNNQVIEIIAGTSIGEVVLITDYVGSTKVATATFLNAPDSTSEYVIHNHSGQCQQQILASPKTIKLSSTASSNDDFYNNCYIKAIGIERNSHVYKITDYNGSTKVATINEELSHYIDTNTVYIIYGESGLATSATSTTLVLQASHGHDTTDDVYNSLVIEIYEGTGSGQNRIISDYVGATRTVTVSS